jgi:hypothetical protein
MAAATVKTVAMMAEMMAEADITDGKGDGGKDSGNGKDGRDGGSGCLGKGGGRGRDDSGAGDGGGH